MSSWSKTRSAINTGYGINTMPCTCPRSIFAPGVRVRGTHKGGKRPNVRSRRNVQGGSIADIFSQIGPSLMEGLKGLAEQAGTSLLALLKDPKRLMSLAATAAPALLAPLKKLFGKKFKSSDPNAPSTGSFISQSKGMHYLTWLLTHDPPRFKTLVYKLIDAHKVAGGSMISEPLTDIEAPRSDKTKDEPYIPGVSGDTPPPCNEEDLANIPLDTLMSMKPLADSISGVSNKKKSSENNKTPKKRSARGGAYGFARVRIGASTLPETERLRAIVQKLLVRANTAEQDRVSIVRPVRLGSSDKIYYYFYVLGSDKVLTDLYNYLHKTLLARGVSEGSVFITPVARPRSEAEAVRGLAKRETVPGKIDNISTFDEVKAVVTKNNIPDEETMHDLGFWGRIWKSLSSWWNGEEEEDDDEKELRMLKYKIAKDKALLDNPDDID